MMTISRAFTLIELLIVIAIIAVLAGLVLGSAAVVRRKAIALDCQQRMDGVLEALSHLGRDQGNACYGLQRSAGLGGIHAWGPDGRKPLNGATGSALGYGSPYELKFPWGRVSDSDNDGVFSEAPVALTLAQLSPMRSAEILQAIGIVPAGPAGLASYAGDRSPRAAWNDPWGHPLVVAYAIYQPQTDNTTDQGARLRSALKAYQFNRACWMAVGSCGPIPRAPLPPAVAASDLIALWSQVTDVCIAGDWSEKAFTAPPWKGVRSLVKGTETCFLSAPVELK